MSLVVQVLSPEFQLAKLAVWLRTKLRFFVVSFVHNLAQVVRHDVVEAGFILK